MRRISEIVGKQIVNAESGGGIGRVADLLIDEDHHRLLGLVVTRGWLAQERILPYRGVLELGDVVVADTREGLLNPQEWRKAGVHAIPFSTLTGKVIVTSDGERLGQINDGLVEEQSGSLQAFLVASADPFDPWTQYRLIVTSPAIDLAEKSIVVPSVIVQHLEQQPPRS